MTLYLHALENRSHKITTPTSRKCTYKVTCVCIHHVLTAPAPASPKSIFFLDPNPILSSPTRALPHQLPPLSSKFLTSSFLLIHLHSNQGIPVRNIYISHFQARTVLQTDTQDWRPRRAYAHLTRQGKQIINTHWPGHRELHAPINETEKTESWCQGNHPPPLTRLSLEIRWPMNIC